MRQFFLPSTIGKFQVFLLALLSALAVGSLAFFPVTNLDVGLHIRTGQTIVENLAVPKTNIFSAVNSDYPMTDDKWLFQVVAYTLYSLGGFDALLVLRLFLVAVIFGVLVWVEWERGHIVSSLLPVVPAAVAANERFMVRPDLASLAFLAAYLALLRSDQRCSSRRRLWLIPLLHLLWVNTHGYFLTGLFIIGCFWLVEAAAALHSRSGKAISRGTTADPPRRGRSAPDQIPGGGRLKTLTWVLLACVAAGFINPNLHRGALFPLRTLSELWGSSSVLLEGIQEFFSPWSLFPYRINAVFVYRLMAVSSTPLIAAASVVDWRRRRRGESGRMPPAYLLVYAAFFVMSLKMRRNIAQYAVVTIPVLCVALRILATELKPRFARGYSSARHLVAGLVLLGAAYLCLDVVSNRFYFRDRSPRFFGHGVSRVLYPEKAFEFIESAGIAGPVFNSFGTGSWFVYSFFPERRPFIDGNTFGYDVSFYKTYYNALVGRLPYREIARRWGVEWFLFAALEANPAVVQALRRDPSWSLVYFDGNTLIFVRRRGLNAQVAARFGVDLESLRRDDLERRLAFFDPPRGWFTDLSAGAARLLGVPAVYPMVRANAAFYLARLGRLDLARHLYEEVLAVNPDLFEAHTQLGWILSQQGELSAGIARVRRGLQGAPDYADGWAILSDLEMKAGDSASAVESLRQAVRLDRHGVAYAIKLAQILRSRSERPEAIRILDETLEHRPRDPRVLIELVAVEIEAEKVEEAQDHLEILREVESANPVIDYYRGLIAESRRRWAEAASAYERYLAERPGLPDVLYHLAICSRQMGRDGAARQALEEARRHAPPGKLRQAIEALGNQLDGGS